MKKISVLLLLLALAGCQQPDVPEPALFLRELTTNSFSTTFFGVNLSARSSVNAVTISGRVRLDERMTAVQEYGFCLSETDSLPQITNPNHRRVVANVTDRYELYMSIKAGLTNLKRGQTYFVDPYVVLANGSILYGRYNYENRGATGPYKAISFRLPERPAVQPARIVPRASIPTPVVGGSSPNPYQQRLVIANDRLYAFYPSGELTAYDPATDRWEQRASLGVNVFGDSPIVFPVGPNLYVHSSPNYWYGSARPAPSMWEYDAASDKWANLGPDLGVNLFNNTHILSTDNQAFFSGNYPGDVLQFDARQRKTTVVNRPTLRRNYNSAFPYRPITNGAFFSIVYRSSVPVPYPDPVPSYIVRYEPTTDQLREEEKLVTALRQQQYINVDFFTPLGDDLLMGFGSRLNIVLNPGSVKATNYFFRDELLRYSTAEQRLSAYYDLSGLVTNLDNVGRQYPFVVGNRLFIFSPENATAFFKEVVPGP
jgi:hypothetical protein